MPGLRNGGAHVGCGFVRVTESRRIVRPALDLHPTDFEHLEARVADARLQRLSLVSSNRPSLSASGRLAIDAGRVYEILGPAPAAFGRELAQHGLGFVEANEAGRGGTEARAWHVGD